MIRILRLLYLAKRSDMEQNKSRLNETDFATALQNCLKAHNGRAVKKSPKTHKKAA